MFLFILQIPEIINFIIEFSSFISDTLAIKILFDGYCHLHGFHDYLNTFTWKILHFCFLSCILMPHFPISFNSNFTRKVQAICILMYSNNDWARRVLMQLIYYNENVALVSHGITGVPVKTNTDFAYILNFESNNYDCIFWKYKVQ